MYRAGSSSLHFTLSRKYGSAARAENGKDMYAKPFNMRSGNITNVIPRFRRRFPGSLCLPIDAPGRLTGILLGSKHPASKGLDLPGEVGNGNGRIRGEVVD